MTTRLAVTGMAVDANWRTITLDYTRAPEPDEAMDAREWADVRRDFVHITRTQQVIDDGNRQGSDLYGHAVRHCDEAGCAGDERYLGCTLDPEIGAAVDSLEGGPLRGRVVELPRSESV